MTNPELHEMLEFFGQEQACYTVLLDLSRRQRAIISDGPIDELLGILGQKQQVLAKIGDIEERLRPFKLDWSSVQESLDENDRQVLDLALGTVEELLSELIALEKECEAMLVERRDETGRKLEETVKAGAVNQVYAAPTGGPPTPILDIRNDA